MKYVISLILIVVGFLFIWKTNAFIKAFGRVAWAEEKLGGGGTWTFYKILGVICILMGFMIMFGFFYWLLDLLFIPG
ncbi:MAG: hypothetical protein A2458_04645 [Candidatus Kerfeldbacteria bacterium RIFOXYC2_FULL_38_9]|uniref:Uncharacterized protein n=1 Tax=Candidatus Kerfeldbacteria bacterium RIFOXYB2_FULL_38_14 TaxID=1798547 RepID=A0A1G2BDZ5_9BACT|nr:MAG: hypothetical protein A2319_05335 [Candidatus Kerfeldbacteria bacterium RIFOXYB2_FULL_38_14]OGY90496.1 MAG: hypothetical protein A2458_04645 [Candidatus Kerfeldbacteria bacterium RIFOXYC2_FULL_38_9]